MNKLFRFRDIDWLLLAVAIAIATIGVLEIYSTTAHSALEGQFKKQIYWIILSVILALVVSRVDYHFLLAQTPWLYILSLLLLGELLVAGHAVAGAKRWIHFGGFTFPSVRISQIRYNNGCSGLLC